ncbi:hypothetical protein [Mesorhizobium sp. LNJC405B00]|uniref:hypothetical protein n=1 Tax=unclassified Mesorhizobium TaxID=325217 RepID=UPI0003CEAEA8|nr:hypothetical protein [Mesorhizobium sp. LNJC405B00]ESY02731.1 hypothetical protein X755_00390 [Mesorhizobium sp. LNJC405B00]
MGRPKTVLGILRIVHASGDALDTRIRLQKETFLLAALGLEDFDITDFEYHHYGPYSRTVSDALQFAVSFGLLEEYVEYFDDSSNGNSRYSYKLTGDGVEFIQENETSRPFDKADQVHLMNKKHWRCLELAATAKYLELREGFVSADEAFVEAVRLKPATKAYYDEAKALLEKLEHGT